MLYIAQFLVTTALFVSLANSHVNPQFHHLKVYSYRFPFLLFFLFLSLSLQFFSHSYDASSHLISFQIYLVRWRNLFSYFVADLDNCTIFDFRDFFSLSPSLFSSFLVSVTRLPMHSQRPISSSIRSIPFRIITVIKNLMSLTAAVSFSKDSCK